MPNVDALIPPVACNVLTQDASMNSAQLLTGSLGHCNLILEQNNQLFIGHPFCTAKQYKQRHKKDIAS